MSDNHDCDDWSIDLETLGKLPTSAMVSIGAVQFNRDTGAIGCKTFIPIDLDSALSVGTVSGDTISWWMSQSDAARQQFSRRLQRFTVHEALEQLASLVRSKSVGARLWGNGSIFDISILEYSYAKAGKGLTLPCSFWNVRDMRTSVDDSGLDLRALPRCGTHHNAVDDAMFQAISISLARRRIRAARGDALTSWAGPKEYAKFDVKPGNPPTDEEDDEL